MKHLFKLTAGGSLFALALLTLLSTTVAKADGPRGDYYSRSESERGSSGGSSHSNYRDHIHEGFRTNETWGHDYGRSWNKGGYEDPIMRRGEQVGVRGREWDRESGHKRDWGSFTGDRWGSKRSSWGQGGREFGWGSGRRSFSGGSFGGGFPSDGGEE